MKNLKYTLPAIGILPVFAYADVSSMTSQITQGLNGIEAAIYSIGAIGVAIAIAFVAVRLVKKGARSAG